MSRVLGARFEQLAANFLKTQGFRLLEANYTCKGGEIDLVCDDHGTLVFVEVRARRSNRFGSPEETVGSTKQRRLIHAARHYLMVHQIEDRACRFDVVAIVMEDETLTHFPDAFSA